MTTKDDLEQLECKVCELKKEVKALESLAKGINGKLSRLDTVGDISKNYGLDGDTMYYIGTGTGRVYKKPINAEILEKISKVKRTNIDLIREINLYFIGEQK